MSYWESILLGIVQGLGEFLPISSSAHLVIAPWFVQFKDPGLAFDVALHLGTLFAVVAFFWKDWWQIIVGSLKYLGNKGSVGIDVQDARVKQSQSNRTEFSNQTCFNLLIYLIIATIPAAIAGVLLNEWAETTLRQPLLVAINMILLGAILLFADRKLGANKNLKDVTLWSAVLIGIAQCFALFPGVSRSGVTITAALALGFSRTESARFSFLMSTPIIFGACVFKYKYFAQALGDPKALIGIFAAAVFGFLSIKYLLKLVQNFSYAAFCYYRFAFGIGVFVVYFVRSL